ncbi:MAG: 50S ribosomal protein L31 [Elusimicrobia bacterium]|nr:50S ribosomal protein L31 [Elusimicrobiota bacterium]
MKAGIHPVYVNAKVVCACGNTFETRSTKELIKLEICSNCHPFYTGQQRLVDTAGRVERFRKRFQATEGKTVTRQPVKPATVKKLEHVGTAAAAKRKVLTTAPKKESKETKPSKKAEKPSKKAA